MTNARSVKCRSKGRGGLCWRRAASQRLQADQPKQRMVIHPWPSAESASGSAGCGPKERPPALVRAAPPAATQGQQRSRQGTELQLIGRECSRYGNRSKRSVMCCRPAVLAAMCQLAQLSPHTNLPTHQPTRYSSIRLSASASFFWIAASLQHTHQVGVSGDASRT